MRSGEIRTGTQVLSRYTQCVMMMMADIAADWPFPPLNAFLRNNKGLPVRQHWKGLNKRKEYDETKERFSFEKDVAISFQVLWWNARAGEKRRKIQTAPLALANSSRGNFVERKKQFSIGNKVKMIRTWGQLFNFYFRTFWTAGIPPLHEAVLSRKKFKRPDEWFAIWAAIFHRTSIWWFSPLKTYKNEWRASR
jgi:hypothetical protein